MDLDKDTIHCHQGLSNRAFGLSRPCHRPGGSPDAYLVVSKSVCQTPHPAPPRREQGLQCVAAQGSRVGACRAAETSKSVTLFLPKREDASIIDLALVGRGTVQSLLARDASWHSPRYERTVIGYVDVVARSGAKRASRASKDTA